MKTHKNLGAVTVRDVHGNNKTYVSLNDAVKHIGPYYIEKLRVGRLGYRHNFDYCRKPSFLSGYFYRSSWFCGDSHVFSDDLGLTIPVWKVKEAYSNLPNLVRHRRRRYHPKTFRNSPVPGVHRRSYGSYWRIVKTNQEIRENDFLNYDEDCLEYGIKVRGPRRHGILVDSYDDPCRGRRGDSWKNYRKTQYKGY